MLLSTGNDGWVRVTDAGLGAPLYVRLFEGNQIWRVCEVYVDGRGKRLTSEVMRSIPIGAIEALVNSSDQARDALRHGVGIPGPDLSTLARFYGTTFGYHADDAGPRHWVEVAFLSQMPDMKDVSNPATDPWWDAAPGDFRDFGKKVKLPRERRQKQDTEVVLAPGDNADGLTDDFLLKVAAAYDTAIRNGLPPANELSRQMRSVGPRTVHSWVRKARERGLMEPAASRGRIR